MAALLLAAAFSLARSSLSAAACALHHGQAMPHAQSKQTLHPQLPKRDEGVGHFIVCICESSARQPRAA